MIFLKNTYGILIFLFFACNALLFANLDTPAFEDVITSQIKSAIKQSDGKLVVAGDFEEGFLYRIKKDHTIDWDFMKNNELGGFNRSVHKIKVLPEDNIIAVGDFTAYDQSIIGGIVNAKCRGRNRPLFFRKKWCWL